ncbi:MAG TPA: UDP-N-acetylglucosamine--N-acetylmuramyl-(pentapeptide) pyrophosphoryl-undecaprenol N-acetylglucosamine transferase [Candidatus Limnocylindrales bacterium]|nr:UDP-N-acetylglucosamine--N-acetylmuramyl-(pentapeptide) pyrophosphoryl-undecaprenol N-acetylglucosamine transferase [Candidatus Limnocylindrales bacterium]
MRLLIAGGGTGGHIFPALAVARSLSVVPGAPELRWLGGHRGLEGTLVPAAGVPFQRLAVRSLRTVERDVHLVLDPLRLAASVPQAAAILARERPAAILTTGGYVALPVAIAAIPFGIPIVLWEGNVVPGRSARVVARRSSVVAVSSPETCSRLAAGGPCFVTGTPIRELRSVDRVAAREGLGVGPADRVLVIFGGSQAVRRFNRAVSEALPRLVEQVIVVHVTGDDGIAGALADREQLPVDRRGRYRPRAFLGDEMTEVLAAADVLVGRAGASTLAEAAALGLPMIVVPYPHAAGHQLANARALEAAGAARLVPDEAFDAASLLEAAALAREPQRHLEMSAAARAFGRPGAADAVAALVMAVAERRPLPTPQDIEQLAVGVAA